MGLRIFVCVVMVAFSLWHFITESLSDHSLLDALHYSGIYLIVSGLLVFGLGPRGLFTWPLATLLLLLRGHWVIGWIPLALVVFNLIGNKIVSGQTQIVSNFISYCKSYLQDKHGLTPLQAQLLVLDPELGHEMDVAKKNWIKEDLRPNIDPDTYLVPEVRTMSYDSLVMVRINKLLDRFAEEYHEREPHIKEYLRQIGHPLGKDK